MFVEASTSATASRYSTGVLQAKSPRGATSIVPIVSRKPGSDAGAGLMPQLPTTSVVIPWSALVSPPG